MTGSKKTLFKAKRRKAKLFHAKLQLLDEMLRRPEGSTVVQLSKTSAWQARGIRGAVPGALRERAHLAVVFGKAESGNRVYRIFG